MSVWSSLCLFSLCGPKQSDSLRGLSRWCHQTFIYYITKCQKMWFIKDQNSTASLFSSIFSAEMSQCSVGQVVWVTVVKVGGYCRTDCLDSCCLTSSKYRAWRRGCVLFSRCAPLRRRPGPRPGTRSGWVLVAFPSRGSLSPSRTWILSTHMKKISGFIVFWSWD